MQVKKKGKNHHARHLKSLKCLGSLCLWGCIGLLGDRSMQMEIEAHTGQEKWKQKNCKRKDKKGMHMEAQALEKKVVKTEEMDAPDLANYPATIKAGFGPMGRSTKDVASSQRSIKTIRVYKILAKEADTSWKAKLGPLCN